MKAITKRIFSIILSTMLPISAQSFPALAAREGPKLETKLEIDDLWLSICELEKEQYPCDYAALIPQIEQMVLSYDDYKEDTMTMRDGSLYWWGDEMMQCYNPAFRSRMKQMNEEEPEAEAPELSGDFNETETYGTVEKSFRDPLINTVNNQAVNVSVLLPYYGFPRDYFGGVEQEGKDTAKATGGTCSFVKGKEVTIDKIASAIESNAVVIIGTHGIDGQLCIHSREGLSDKDFNSFHAVYSGPEEGHDIWLVDGTAITNHMTKDAPNNLVMLATCMGMKNDDLCQPLRDKGVGVVFGFSETVSAYGSSLMSSAFLHALAGRETVAQAVQTMREEVGCDWDPAFDIYTTQLAEKSEVAFPIVVSADDNYPGEGNVNIVQTVKSQWRLPVSNNITQDIILHLGEYDSVCFTNTPDVDYSNMSFFPPEAEGEFESARVVEGSLPSGMLWAFTFGSPKMYGFPDKKGVSNVTIRLKTKTGREYDRKYRILVADFNNIIKTSETKTVTAANVKKYNRNLKSIPMSDTVNIRFSFWTISKLFSLSGSCPLSLECISDPCSMLQGGRFRQKESVDLITPGHYVLTATAFTYDGNVFQHTIDLTVKPRHIYSEGTINLTVAEGEEMEYLINTQAVDKETKEYIPWGETASIHKIQLLNGTKANDVVTSEAFPHDVFLKYGFNYPLGLYGTPQNMGKYLTSIRLVTAFDYYDYNFVIDVKKPITGSVSIKNETVAIGSELELKERNLPEIAFQYIWEYTDDSSDAESWQKIPNSWNAATYTVEAAYAGKYIRARLVPSNSDYMGDKCTSPRQVQSRQALTGEIVYTSPVKYGTMVTTGRSGLLGSIDKDKISYTWQTNTNIEYDKNWIDVGTGFSYTPEEKDMNRYLRVKASVKDYAGNVYSVPTKIEKADQTEIPEPPILKNVVSYTSKYEDVEVVDSLGDQEYLLTTSSAIVPTDWSKAKKGNGRSIYLECPSNQKVYVYTRLAENTTHKAGTATRYNSIYTGEDKITKNIHLSVNRVITGYDGIQKAIEKANGFEEVLEQINGRNSSEPENGNAEDKNEKDLKTILEIIEKNGGDYVLDQNSFHRIDTTIEFEQSADRKIWNKITFEQDDQGAYYIKEDDVVKITASPLPENPTSFSGIRGNMWLINSSRAGSQYGKLYADAACKNPLVENEYYKTVYFKPAEGKIVNSLEIKAQYTISNNEIVTDAVMFHVGSIDGEFKADNMQFQNVTIRKGQKLECLEYITYPEKATLGTISISPDSKDVGRAPIVKIDKDSRSFSVDAENADVGVHHYNLACVNGPSCTLTLNVLSEMCNVTLTDDSGGKNTKSVKYLSEFVLPAYPEEFACPADKVFDGWNLGNVGERIVVTDDIEIKSVWKPHEHSLIFVPEKKATCLMSGISAHYYCEKCGKEFSDEEGTQPAPTADYFLTPATGHVYGETIYETKTEPTCTLDGICNEIVYCADCGEELESFKKILPATGHSVVHIPAREPTCLEEGNIEFYVCEHCEKKYADEDLKVELNGSTDISPIGHNWGKTVYTWSEDFGTVIAKRVCKNDPEHDETESVKTVKKEIPATESGNGSIIYTATFINPEFSAQEKVIVIPMITTTTAKATTITAKVTTTTAKATTTTAKATTTTAKATTTTAKVTTTTAKATTTTAKATTTTAKATTTTAKVTMTTAKATTATAKATTTTAKATTTTAKVTTTTAKATTNTAKVTTTTAKATTTTDKATTTTAKATTTTAKATTTTAKATTTTAKATTTTAKATTTTAKATTTTAKATTTTAKATTTTAKATTTTAKATTTTAKATTTTATATTTTAKATTTTAKATTTTAKATTTTAKATTTTAKATTTAEQITTTVPETTAPAVTTTAGSGVTPPESKILTGDINNDGKVSVEDAQLALKAYTNRIAGKGTGLTEEQVKAANVNGDEELSVDDAQNILKYYTQKYVAGRNITWDDIFGKKAQPFPSLPTPQEKLLYEPDKYHPDNKTSADS